MVPKLTLSAEVHRLVPKLFRAEFTRAEHRLPHVKKLTSLSRKPSTTAIVTSTEYDEDLNFTFIHKPALNLTDQPFYSCPEDFVIFYNFTTGYRKCFYWKNLSKRIIDYYTVQESLRRTVLTKRS